MNRISFAFRSLFSILFSGTLAPDIALAFGYSKAMPVKAAAPPKPQAGPADGAVQILSLLQRDARLVDFLMEEFHSRGGELVLNPATAPALDRLRISGGCQGVGGVPPAGHRRRRGRPPGGGFAR